MGPSRHLARLRATQPTMVDQLACLVGLESPSADLAACGECAAAVAELGATLLGRTPDFIEVDGHIHLRWRFGGSSEVALIGHFDTVWPVGTTARWPFSVVEGRASGPGAFDMKAGIIQAFHALACLEDLDGVALLLTSDEEVGSLSSRSLVEETATGCLAALVLEPSAGGALKVARKGISLYRLDVTGRAAHAGLEPELGGNATVELAQQVLAAVALARPDLGTTVTPTVAASGSTTNTVPAAARLHLDVRATTFEEQQRVDGAIRGMSTVVPGTAIRVEGGPNRPPLPAAASTDLMALAKTVAATIGLGNLAGVAVGGGSDGNFSAGIGVPTLDGLGAVGDEAHAEGEHVLVETMPERAALLAGLVEDLLR